MQQCPKCGFRILYVADCRLQHSIKLHLCIAAGKAVGFHRLLGLLSNTAAVQGTPATQWLFQLLLRQATCTNPNFRAGVSTSCFHRLAGSAAVCTVVAHQGAVQALQQLKLAPAVSILHH